jgi:hypothetical protein
MAALMMVRSPEPSVTGGWVEDHMLRHVYASTLLSDGVSVAAVASWLGHGDGGALLLRTYAHVCRPTPTEVGRCSTPRSEGVGTGPRRPVGEPACGPSVAQDLSREPFRRSGACRAVKVDYRYK